MSDLPLAEQGPAPFSFVSDHNKVIRQEFSGPPCLNVCPETHEARAMHLMGTRWQLCKKGGCRGDRDLRSLPKPLVLIDPGEETLDGPISWSGQRRRLSPAFDAGSPR